MKAKEVREEIAIPQGVQVTVNDNLLNVKGPKGAVEREFPYMAVVIAVEGGNVVLSAKNVDKRKKRMLNTYTAHIANMIAGVTNGVVYKLKICSGHFPMNVAVSGDAITVKNFLGEKVPRMMKLKGGVKVKIDAQIISVEGADLELVSQTAASIEKLTRRAGFDFNRFQDGIYIIEKNGEKI